MRLVVSHRRATGTDQFGQKVYAAAVSLGSCVVAPGGSAEVNDRGETVDTSWTVYAPHTTAVQPADRLEIPGFGSWEVDGSPAPWVSPFSGRRAGTEIRVRKVIG